MMVDHVFEVDKALSATAYIQMRLIFKYGLHTKLHNFKVDRAFFAAAYIQMRFIFESGLQ